MIHMDGGVDGQLFFKFFSFFFFSFSHQFFSSLFKKTNEKRRLKKVEGGNKLIF